MVTLPALPVGRSKDLIRGDDLLLALAGQLSAQVCSCESQFICLNEIVMVDNMHKIAHVSSTFVHGSSACKDCFNTTGNQSSICEFGVRLEPALM